MGGVCDAGCGEEYSGTVVKAIKRKALGKARMELEAELLDPPDTVGAVTAAVATMRRLPQVVEGRCKSAPA